MRVIEQTHHTEQTLKLAHTKQKRREKETSSLAILVPSRFVLSAVHDITVYYKILSPERECDSRR